MTLEKSSRQTGTPKSNRMYTAQDALLETQSLTKKLGAPYAPGEKLQQTFEKVVRNARPFVRMSCRQAKAYWFGERKIIPAYVLENFRRAVEAHERRLDAELATIRARYHALAYHSTDPEFVQGRLAEIDPRLAGLGGKASPLDEPEGV